MTESTDYGGGRKNRFMSFRGNAVRNLKPEKKTVVWRSLDNPAFVVRVSARNGSGQVEKAFCVEGTMPDGRFTRVTIGSADSMTVPQAAAIAEEWYALIKRGVHPKKHDGRKTLEAALKKMEDEKVGHRRASTNTMSWGMLDRFFADWKDKPLSSITPEMVKERFIEITTQVEKNKRSKGGKSSANAAMRVLQAVWNWNRKEWKLPDSPTQVLSEKQMWHRERPRRRILNRSERRRLVRALLDRLAANPRDVYAAWTLCLLLTGRRHTELRLATWSEVDLSEGLILLPPERVKSDEELRLPLPGRVVAILKPLEGMHDHWVFRSPTKDGPVGAPYMLVKQFFDGEVTPHDLRRTWAVIAEDTTTEVRRKLGVCLAYDAVIREF